MAFSASQTSAGGGIYVAQLNVKYENFNNQQKVLWRQQLIDLALACILLSGELGMLNTLTVSTETSNGNNFLHSDPSVYCNCSIMLVLWFQSTAVSLC